MHTSLFVVAAAGAVSVLALSSPSQPLLMDTGLPLGANCNPAVPDTCANGVDCYATNFMLMPRCGNFQASCTSDSQCAFNACNRAQGLCNGFLATSATTSSTASSTKFSSTTADIGLPLGVACDPSTPNACADGIKCYATNSGLIPVCGNFQAPCTSSDQCAFNTCNNGFCNGYIASTNVTTSGAYTLTTSIPTNHVVFGNSSVTSSAASPTSTTPLITNDATKMSWSLAGLVAIASLVAFAL